MGKPLKKRVVVKDPTPPEHPWERQIGETDSAWEAFAAYRDMGPGERSHGKLSQKFGKTPENFGRWSIAWQWVARCHAYDSWRDREQRKVEMEAVKDMRRRHIQMAMSFQGAAALALNKIIAAEKAVVRNADGTTSPAPLTLKPGEVKELADLGIKLERLNRGEPETITEERIVPDAEPSGSVVHNYTRLSREELKALRGLVDKARHDDK
jgi:hypothetical protein